MTQLELWGGIECTHNRVGDRYFDQLTRSGHRWRMQDLDQIRDLGIRTLRYPVLWEHTAPHGVASANWTWADERLGRLRELGIRPIVGLVHHGSGPASTNLMAPSFIDGLEEFADAVAERYPWVDAYTPVNEPLTTARFSGLYGHWYPHQTSDRAFLQAVLTQLVATQRAMRAIRRRVPDAQLVQTEDIGLVRSTRAVAYQAAFENERRWLSLDLLMGRVDASHPLWRYLRRHHADVTWLSMLREEPCPPDIIGLNYYLTSDRYLDHRAQRYPTHPIGGNGRHTYVDLEAVRVRRAGLAGHARHLLDAWERYRRPLAITEVHAGCSREEQARWLHEAWTGAHAARAEGADVRAVTMWALLGSFEWNSLVTRENGYYEPGVFDVRAPEPRPTLLARVVRQLAAGENPSLPALASPGWWRRSDRYGKPAAPSALQGPCILITGARGTLGRALGESCARRGLPHRLLTHADLDIADPLAVQAALTRYRPWAVINAAGYVDVDRAEREEERCHRANSVGPAVLAAACANDGVRLVTFSTDLVFDGATQVPYVESTALRPLNVYGRTKAEGEASVLAITSDALIIRTSAFFGPSDDYNFITVALRHCAGSMPFRAAEDVIISPTYVPELAEMSLDLLLDGERGVWHLANAGAVSWADLARAAAAEMGVDPMLIHGVPADELGWAAPRPTFSVLGSERGSVMSSIDVALGRYCAAITESLSTPLQLTGTGG